MVSFSLGYNFDLHLLDQLAQLNQASSTGQISEVFAAVRSGPVPSARTGSKVPDLSLSELGQHVRLASQLDIEFNYLLNTHFVPEKQVLHGWLSALEQQGIQNVTVGSLELASLVAEMFPNMRQTLSLTARVSDRHQIAQAVSAGIDNIYLDAVTVNRDFSLLRTLVSSGSAQFRLYANVSCISGCPVMSPHYKVFGRSLKRAAELNELFFFSCSMVKASSPVEWMQMPWIRPEDIDVYVSEGICHFKLSDRLASTAALLRIAQAYLSRISPDNMFSIIERDGNKFASVWAAESGAACVSSAHISPDWIDHFRDGTCKSLDPSCPRCIQETQRAIHLHGFWPNINSEARDKVNAIPKIMSKRIAQIY